MITCLQNELIYQSIPVYRKTKSINKSYAKTKDRDVGKRWMVNYLKCLIETFIAALLFILKAKITIIFYYFEQPIFKKSTLHRKLFTNIFTQKQERFYTRLPLFSNMMTFVAGMYLSKQGLVAVSVFWMMIKILK